MLIKIKNYMNEPIKETYITKNTLPDITFILTLAIIMMVIIANWFFSFVPSSSMRPTFEPNEYLICKKTKSIEYGDIVVFWKDNATLYTKRAIGKEGDRIAVHDGIVYRNGEALEEPYIAEPPKYELEEMTVPEGQFFFLGDNRNFSADSSKIGCVDASSVVGRCVLHFNPSPIYDRIVKGK